MSLFYNSPSTVPLGLLAAIATLAIAGATLWRSAVANARQRMTDTLMSVLLIVTGVAELATSAHLALVQVEFASNYSTSPKTAAPAIWAQIFVMLVMVGLMITALLQRHAIAVATMATLAAMSAAVFTDLAMYRVFTDGWAIAISAGWILSVSAIIGLVATCATATVRAYGQKQFQRGQMAALDQLKKDNVEI